MGNFLLKNNKRCIKIIIINIDVMLTKRKMSVTELSERVGITMTNLSVLKNGKAEAILLSTLEAICKALECQPGDIFEYQSESTSNTKNRFFLGGEIWIFQNVSY
ncbi:helix-turn-helix domain-containing protein [Metabacillus malikii]|uniref:Transcriptional regulator n=1 Tax=Metabacillus malikii TaxID=1504265 RepID=A0ABT9ZK31_9BACI|nr:helix-turn-helix transcriptional regulator [Metabacillus malikii]MDQ0232622.1 putative transcriptional regulator [Metabacillus malikii]